MPAMGCCVVRDQRRQVPPSSPPATPPHGASLDLPSAIARLTSGPAAILGLPLGNLARGQTADVCVFDPEAQWRIGPETWRSQGHNTPFRGDPMTGRVTWTLLGGRIVHELRESPR